MTAEAASEPAPAGPAPDPAVPWDERMSQHWLADLERREAQLEPVLDALFERAGLRDGMRVDLVLFSFKMNIPLRSPAKPFQVRI